MQALTARDTDDLFGKLTLAPRTARQAFVVLKACLASAVKKKVLAFNPAADAEKSRAAKEESGRILDEGELAELVRGFRAHSIYPIVATAAFTGMRKGEVLALERSDIDLAKRTISISRSVEEVCEEGEWVRRTKGPKTARGVRMIESLKTRRVCWEAAATRCPQTVYGMFAKRARELGLACRFHDLRSSHATIMLYKSVPGHVVAARLGMIRPFFCVGTPSARRRQIAPRRA